MNNKRLTLAIAGVILAPLMAMAEGPNLPSFDEVDMNSDGGLSQQEVRNYVDKRSRGVDFNRNGQVDATEIAEFVPSMNERQAANYIELMDRDGDDELSYDEMAQDVPMLFKMADADGDGKVSRAEFDATQARYGH
ncbi:EF-hand domain-containing protein [Epibacterium sp. DP7N7-1]|nr:EF-hand domain-containing protein [Epibacterium sp. DP7N7-1]